MVHEELAGSIMKWANLELLFLAHFFEDDMKISMPTLLATKQKKGESIKTFVERFWGMVLLCPSVMTQSTLVGLVATTCKHSWLR